MNAPRFREGRDYSSFAEAQAILDRYGVADMAVERPTTSAAAAAWAQQVLYELRMFNRTNQFRDGRAWGDQPWWLIELLNRFWDGLDAGEEDASRSA